MNVKYTAPSFHWLLSAVCSVGVMIKKPVKYFVVDAFAESAFKGNPAAVCLLEDEDERDDEWMQSLAAEFNISETCYLTRIAGSVANGSSIPRFRLRWFTPVSEVKLCGHATLASAHALFSNGVVDSDMVEFETLSGILTAKRVPETKSSCSVELNFPQIPIAEFNSMDVSIISKALNGASIVDIKQTTSEHDIFVELQSWESVTELQPNFEEIIKLPGRGIIVTAAASASSEFDFCSRFFCPKLGINEDPVCGSAHCALAPYWSKKLNKTNFTAYAASPRSGTLKIHLDETNQRVRLVGKAVTVTEGRVLV